MTDHQPPGLPQPAALNGMQDALFELHHGLMNLKESLQELARLHEEEMAAHLARIETDKLLQRLRRPA